MLFLGFKSLTVNLTDLRIQIKIVLFKLMVKLPDLFVLVLELVQLRTQTLQFTIQLFVRFISFFQMFTLFSQFLLEE